MLQLRSFTFNPFSENTYVIINEKKECWIVDPGMYDIQETNELIRFFEQHDLKPRGIINTHTHIDHILGVKALVDKYNITFGIHTKDEIVLQNALGSAMMFGLALKSIPKPDFYIKEGEPLKLGEDLLEVRLAPGHSPGSIVFYSAEDKWVIGGDVLFAGSIGRSDLPGGNHETLLNSIRTQLFTLPEDTAVFPGHGPATTVGQEIATNPFF
jgi:hydroxyacylglutathione hydrolase